MSIPKILHQIWIGPKSPPTVLMKTWELKHPNLQYILWNEEEIQRRNLVFKCQKQIDMIQEINGKADIIRWEILQKFGGIFVDADSICIEPFNDSFFENTGFATFENKKIRDDLIATGTMGFVPEHTLLNDIIYSISNGKHDDAIQTHRAWASVGPALLTDFLNTQRYQHNMTIYPSHYFLPIHFTGDSYDGHKKVYAYQEWGTAKQSYDTINSVVLPPSLLPPHKWVSLMITSYNTSKQFVFECLESVRNQTGHIGIEVVWINDGSDEVHTKYLEELLDWFSENSRFTSVVYHKHFPNSGTAFSNNIGIMKCSHELIFKMDSDDVMISDRIRTQVAFMEQNTDVQVCGSNMKLFNCDNTSRKVCVDETSHPSIVDWDFIKKNVPTWFANHPTLCYRKSAVLSVGNYNVYDNTIKFIQEDYDLELRLVKKYKKLVNLPQSLVLYRLHPQQLTRNHDSNKNTNKCSQMIQLVDSFYDINDGA